MFKDFCAHAAAFYGRRSMVLAYSGTVDEFDAAWKRSWDYQRAATFGRPKLHFTTA